MKNFHKKDIKPTFMALMEELRHYINVNYKDKIKENNNDNNTHELFTINVFLVQGEKAEGKRSFYMSPLQRFLDDYINNENVYQIDFIASKSFEIKEKEIIHDFSSNLPFKNVDIRTRVEHKKLTFFQTEDPIRKNIYQFNTEI